MTCKKITSLDLFRQKPSFCHTTRTACSKAASHHLSLAHYIVLTIHSPNTLNHSHSFSILSWSHAILHHLEHFIASSHTFHYLICSFPMCSMPYLQPILDLLPKSSPSFLSSYIYLMHVTLFRVHHFLCSQPCP